MKEPMTNIEIHLEIDRCLRIVVSKLPQTTWVSSLSDSNHSLEDANFISGQMEQYLLISKFDDARICVVTKLGIDVIHKFGGWLKYCKKERSKRRWDKFFKLSTFGTAIFGALFGGLSYFNSDKKNEDKIHNMGLEINKRIDSLVQKHQK